MRIVLLGDEADARGFALSGVESRVVDAEMLPPALARTLAEEDVGLVLVSASLARSAKGAELSEAPLVLVLPERA
jgi:vacuolar-type H+-ATPase subunit F/Vma7